MSNYQYATRVTLFVIVVLLTSTSAIVHAATKIKGQVLHNGRPAANAKLNFYCDKKKKKPATSKPAITNNYGSFKMSIPGGNKSCDLEVIWNKRTSERVSINMTGSRLVLSLNLRSWKNKWLVEIR